MDYRPLLQKLESIEKMQGQTVYFIRLLAERMHAGELTLPEVWYDNQEVMLILHISESTLKRHRRDGILPYKKIKRKCYYKQADVFSLFLEAKQNQAGGD